jgi:sugar/nucleoside kinase (ribokinase family)
MPKAVIFGDNCLNIILKVPLALRRGANIDISLSVRRPGGNAMVTSIALARWGLDVAYAGVVGKDDPGSQLLDWMHQAGVKTDLVLRRGSTRVSYAIVDAEDRTILDERAGSEVLTPGDWDSASMAGRVRGADVVMLDRYCSAVHGLVVDEVRQPGSLRRPPVLAYRTGSRSSPGFAVENGILPHVDITLTKEAFLRSGEPGNDPEDGCRRFSGRYGTGAVVATLGRSGAAYYDRLSGKASTVPALPVENPLTTLGGGDWFRAGFLLGVLRGYGVADSVRCGNVAAGLHCKMGDTGEIQDQFFAIGELDRVLEVETW